MIQQSVLDVASKVATRQWRANSRLLKETGRRATEIAHDKKIARRTDVQKKLLARRCKIERMHKALQAVAKLCAVGISPQLQSLIKARGRPLVFWGGAKATTPGYDMADIWWKWISSIELTDTELKIDNRVDTSGDSGATYNPHPMGGFAVHLPYGRCKEYLRARPLWDIATHDAIDLNAWYDEDDINFVYSSERLFEILVECCDSRKFGKLFRKAIAR